jgi:hypothetical protein
VYGLLAWGRGRDGLDAFGPGGAGRQADLEGGFFAYPPDAFGRGLIAGRAVPCLSARQQRRFRTGYRHRPQDVTTSPRSTPSATSKTSPRDRRHPRSAANLIGRLVSVLLALNGSDPELNGQLRLEPQHCLQYCLHAVRRP